MCWLFALNTTFSQSNYCDDTPLPPVFEGPAQPTLCQQLGDLPATRVIGVSGTTYSSDIGSSLNGEIISVEGDFTIDNEFTFKDCTLQIKPNVTIWVTQVGNSNSRLTLDNSKLFACENLWKGVYVLKGYLTTKNGTEIEDAENAVEAHGWALLWIQNTTFNRNRIGVNLQRLTCGGKICNLPVVLALSNNYFTCTAPLNGTSNEVSFAGIQLQNGTSIDEAAEASDNDFIGLQYGIYEAQSNTKRYATVLGREFHFKNNKKDGIYLIRGLVELESSLFFNNERNGINLKTAIGFSVRSNCKFEYTNAVPLNTPFGFGTYKCINIENIETNASVSLRNSKVDINVLQNRSIDGIYIKGNPLSRCVVFIGESNIFSLTTDSDNTNAIVLEGNFSANSEIAITDNAFNIESLSSFSQTTAVKCINGDKNNLTISRNTISGMPGGSFFATGVSLRGSQGVSNLISHNTFPNLNSPNILDDNVGNAFVFTNFANITFCENTIYDCEIAFWCTGGVNPNTKIMRNKMYGGSAPVSVQGLIGFQGLSNEHISFGNAWYREAPLILPSQHVICVGTFCDLSKFIVHTPQTATTTTTPSYYPERIDPTDYFIYDPQSTVTGQNCDGNWLIQTIDPLDISIATNYTNNLGLPTTDTWQLRRYLYQKLRSNPSLINSMPEIANFYATESNTSVGKFWAVKDKMHQAALASSGIDTTLRNTKIYRKFLATSLRTVGQVLNGSGTLTEIEQATAQRDTLLNQVMVTEEAYLSVLNQLDTIQTQLLFQSLALNSAVVINTQFEKNQKTVNNIWLRSRLYQNGIFTEQQIDTLLTIARQVPKTGGMAVYEAGGILPACLPDDWNESQEQRPVSSLAQAEDNQGNILIYPNPVSDQVQVRNLSFESCNIELFDATGNLLKSGKMTASETMSWAMPYPGGLYWCRFRSASGKITVIKIIIQH